MKTTSTADGELSWPVQLPLGPHVGPPPAEHDLDGDVLSLRCGTADCKFRVHCYRCFVDPNAKVKNLVKSFEKRSSGKKEEEEVEEEGGDSGKGVKEIGSKMSGLGAPGGLLPKTSNVGAGVVVVEIEGGQHEEGEDGGQRRAREAKTTTFDKSERKGDDGKGEEEDEESGGEKQKLV